MEITIDIQSIHQDTVADNLVIVFGYLVEYRLNPPRPNEHRYLRA